MAIIGALPNTINNGDPIDAVPVMANYNWILAQVNANALDVTQNLADVANPTTSLTNLNGQVRGISYGTAISAAVTINSSQNGQAFAVSAATAAYDITLPAPTAGLAYRFIGSGVGTYQVGIALTSGTLYLPDGTTSAGPYEGVNLSKYGTIVDVWSDGTSWWMRGMLTPTQSAGNNSTKLASTAYADNVGAVITGSDSAAGNTLTITGATRTLLTTESAKAVFSTYAGVVAYTLPTLTKGVWYKFFTNAYANTITGAANSILLPDGTTATSFTMPAAVGGSITLFCDGTNWILASTGRAIIANAVNSNEAVARGQTGLDGINLATGGPYALQVGQWGYLDVSAVTSQALNVATADGERYEIEWVFANTGSGANNPLTLNPNGTTYASAFSRHESFAANTTPSGGQATDSTFQISIGGIPLCGKALISTDTSRQKTCISLTEDIGATQFYCGILISRWLDSTTAYSLLGTLNCATSLTGRIIVRRVA